MQPIISIILVALLFSCKESANVKRKHEAAWPFGITITKLNEIAELESYDSLEQIKKEYTIGVSEDYFPNRKQYLLEQPIIYGKKDGSFEFERHYYFSKADSVVRLIECQWEGTESTSEADFNDKVEQNKQLISRLMGFQGKEIPETEDLAAKTIWSNDNVRVEQFYVPIRLIRILVSWP
ncbi:MAG: hypothetical protein ACXWV2_02210 [Chitinophagaceae bacterium]